MDTFPCMLHIIHSANPLHGQWPTPKGSWRVTILQIKTQFMMHFCHWTLAKHGNLHSHHYLFVLDNYHYDIWNCSFPWAITFIDATNAQIYYSVYGYMLLQEIIKCKIWRFMKMREEFSRNMKMESEIWKNQLQKSQCKDGTNFSDQWLLCSKRVIRPPRQTMLQCHPMNMMNWTHMDTSRWLINAMQLHGPVMTSHVGLSLMRVAAWPRQNHACYMHSSVD